MARRAGVDDAGLLEVIVLHQNLIQVQCRKGGGRMRRESSVSFNCQMHKRMTLNVFLKNLTSTSYQRGTLYSNVLPFIIREVRGMERPQEHIRKVFTNFLSVKISRKGRKPFRTD